jgi:3-oxoacyl-[acyl-carrier-protein] synthase II
MLQLGEVDYALAGGISESAQTFGIFAAFAAQGALGHHDHPALATRPLDKNRNGIVVSEGGCVFLLERLDQALERKAKIYGEILGYHINSDASDYVLPYSLRQKECIQKALQKAGKTLSDVDIINLHATGTMSGDEVECEAVRMLLQDASLWQDISPTNPSRQTWKGPWINGTKGHIGHCMGAAGALELAGNLGSFQDGLIHPFHSMENLDEKCELPGLVCHQPYQSTQPIRVIVNNSFGMLGINSTLVVGAYQQES